LEKAAVIAQINSFGQTPKQLITKPHPRRYVKDTPSRPTVASHPDQFVSRLLGKLHSKGVYVLTYVEGEPVALGPCRIIFWDKYYRGKTRCLQWGNWDGSLRVVVLKDDQVVFSLEGLALQLDTICCADVPQDGSIIACGFRSSLVRIWRKQPRYLKKFQRQQQLRMKQQEELKKRTLELSMSQQQSTSPSQKTLETLSESTNMTRPSPAKSIRNAVIPTNSVSKKVIEIEFVATLDGHMDEVRCIKVSKEHSIVVSGSADRTCIIWDTNRRKIVRSLRGHSGPIVAIDIHPFSGEIVVIDDPGKDNCTIYLWSINGEKIASKRHKPRAQCVVFSQIKPGLGCNVICTGHSNGEIMIWSANDLTLLRSIKGAHQFPVSAIAIREDNRQIVSGDINGLCVVHEYNS